LNTLDVKTRVAAFSSPSTPLWRSVSRN